MDEKAFLKELVSRQIGQRMTERNIFLRKKSTVLETLKRASGAEKVRVTESMAMDEQVYIFQFRNGKEYKVMMEIKHVDSASFKETK